MPDRKKRYQKLDDEPLLRRMARGDEAAAAELYGRYAGRMQRYFQRMLDGDPIRAQDFTQELFLRVIRNAEHFDARFRFTTWLYTIARNLCKNEYRRRDRQPDLHPVEDQPVADKAPAPWRQLDDEAFESALRRCLDELDELPRQCFVLRFQEELSIREISQILECPEGTVKSRLHYTVRKLSDRLQVFNPKT